MSVEPTEVEPGIQRAGCMLFEEKKNNPRVNEHTQLQTLLFHSQTILQAAQKRRSRRTRWRTRRRKILRARANPSRSHDVPPPPLGVRPAHCAPSASSLHLRKGFCFGVYNGGRPHPRSRCPWHTDGLQGTHLQKMRKANSISQERARIPTAPWERVRGGAWGRTR